MLNPEINNKIPVLNDIKTSICLYNNCCLRLLIIIPKKINARIIGK